MSGPWESFASVFSADLMNTFIYLVLNNLGVLLMLWFVSAVWIYYAARIPTSRKRVYRLALCCYLFFFAKELFRINQCILEFCRDSMVPYRAVLVNLILPHGIPEYFAFVLATAFALIWLARSLESGCWRYPGHRAVLSPVLLAILAAVIEITLTPYLYLNYLSKG